MEFHLAFRSLSRSQRVQVMIEGCETESLAASARAPLGRVTNLRDLGLSEVALEKLAY